MFVTNHVLAGATIGLALGRHPLGAFAAGVVSHFAMDACPHWGIVRDGPDAEARFLHIARCDGCLGLAAMAAGAALAGRGVRPATVAAMVGAALPDLDKPSEYFFGVYPFPAWFRRLHAAVQNESSDRLRSEVMVGVGLAGLAFAAHRFAAKRGEPATAASRR